MSRARECRSQGESERASRSRSDQLAASLLLGGLSRRFAMQSLERREHESMLYNCFRESDPGRLWTRSRRSRRRRRRGSLPSSTSSARRLGTACPALLHSSGASLNPARTCRAASSTRASSAILITVASFDRLSLGEHTSSLRSGKSTELLRSRADACARPCSPQHSSRSPHPLLRVALLLVLLFSPDASDDNVRRSKHALLRHHGQGDGLLSPRSGL